MPLASPLIASVPVVPPLIVLPPSMNTPKPAPLPDLPLMITWPLPVLDTWLAPVMLMPVMGRPLAGSAWLADKVRSPFSTDKLAAELIKMPCRVVIEIKPAPLA